MLFVVEKQGFCYPRNSMDIANKNGHTELVKYMKYKRVKPNYTEDLYELSMAVLTFMASVANTINRHDIPD
jgi:hypothetical protein